MKEAVNHPQHYGGEDNPYEAIKVIEAWGLDFNLGNVAKYISRANRKDDAATDLRKARWYLDREIARIEPNTPGTVTVAFMDTEATIGLTIAQLVEQSFALAQEKGWWPDMVLFNVPEKLALIHSEISEALEEYRVAGTMPRCALCSGTGARTGGIKCGHCDGVGFNAITYGVGGKPEGFLIELADAVIRIADLCGALKLDLSAAIDEKHEYNRTREFRHGGKAC